jgi:hypothetical protein
MIICFGLLLCKIQNEVMNSKKVADRVSTFKVSNSVFSDNSVFFSCNSSSICDNVGLSVRRLVC